MPCMALAKVSGPCANCHTMHASQTPWPTNWGDVNDLPKSALLIGDCVGCHSSGTSSTYYNLGGCEVPVVLYTGGEPTSYLAGGNFWWVEEGFGGDDSKGHNVFLGQGDDYLTEAPGGGPSCGGGVNNCHQNLHLPVSGMPGSGAELNGKYGCEGCHINVRHHANDHPNFDSGYVNTADQGWYRFLSGHLGGAHEAFGVEGYEDNDWEAGHPNLPQGTGGVDSHNEYLGQESSGSGFSLGSVHTTTAFCTGCHGDFHDEQKSDGAWVRHPSDAVIPNTPGSEYADTGGATNHYYDPLSPVAKPTVDTIPDTTVTPGTDFVMCLSCHRPHGSPYPDMLRWDYTTQQAGGGGDDTGCFYCHTTKND
jgi:hypothetical protein